MFRRRLLILTGVVLLLGVVGVALLNWPTTPTPGVSWQNVHRLRSGMPAKHVEALLGESHESRSISLPRYGAGTIKVWRGEIVISLFFDGARQRMVYGGVFPAQPPPLVSGIPYEIIRPDDSFPGHIRRWLHW